jgi:hypothetical protein
MNDQPVTVVEIAELLHHIRHLTEHPTASPAGHAEVLAPKADLLTRIAEQRVDEWGCEHAEQARQIAGDAQAAAQQARQIAAHTSRQPTGAKSQENPTAP